MKVRNLSPRLQKKLEKLHMVDVYNESVAKFDKNPRHPGLHFEVMSATKHMNPVLHSFRINKIWRVEGYQYGQEFQPINVSKHYAK